MSIFFLAFLMGLPVAADIVSLPTTAAVYSRPSPEARVQIRLKEGTRIQVGRQDFGGFRKVFYKSGGQTRQGYMLREIFEVQKRSPWGAGLGVMHSSLSQASRSFKTEDQVNYQIAKTTSASIFPWFNLQYGYGQDFWRLSGGLKLVNFSSTARTDVSAASQGVVIESKFLAGTLQKGWPLLNRHFNFGLGVEAARSLSTSVKIEGQELTMAAGEKPTYFGIQGFIGTHFFVSNSLSVSLHSQLNLITNQKPMIFGFEFAGGMLWWL